MTASSTPPPTCVVVMGVSGSGKSTIANLLADRLGWTMAEADKFHPAANIDKMTAGIPLTDVDRTPWLVAIREWVDRRGALGENTVVTCSALKRSYRDVLRQAAVRVRFVHLHGTTDVVAGRLGKRSGHFMPPSLLGSQFGDLETLRTDEDGVVVDVRDTPRRIVECALTALDLNDLSTPDKQRSSDA